MQIIAPIQQIKYEIEDFLTAKIIVKSVFKQNSNVLMVSS